MCVPNTGLDIMDDKLEIDRAAVHYPHYNAAFMCGFAIFVSGTRATATRLVPPESLSLWPTISTELEESMKNEIKIINNCGIKSAR